jgi:hypothetical protein
MHWEIRDRLDAAAFALGAFAIPYLAAGLRRFAGHNWWWVLVWPKEAGPLWGPLGFELGGCAVVALLVYRLRLQGLRFNQSVVPPWLLGTPLDKALEANAVLTALAVFLVPYLALSVGLGGFKWMALLWPLDIWGNFTRFVLFVLAALAAVSLFVMALKINYLSAVKEYESLKSGTSPDLLLRVQLESCQKEVADLRANAGRASPDSKHEAELALLRGGMKVLRDNLEHETRQSAQARMRAAEAEKKLREMADADGASPDSELAALREEVKSLRDNLESSTRQAAEARMRAAAAEAKLSKMKQKAGGPPPRDEAPAGKGGDKKFTRAKRAFSKMYHPDRIQADGFEKMIRTEFYKEFYQVLEAIDDDKPLP